MKKSIWMMIGLSMVLVGCHHPAKPTEPVSTLQTMTIKKTPAGTTLYFSGILNPLNQEMVSSPADGLVSKINFSYGENVKKGDLLLSIRSVKQQSDYQAALTKYLQAKQTYTQSEDQLNSDQKLFDKGLIPKNTFDQTRNTFMLNHLSLLQAESDLRKSAHTDNIEKLKSLTIENFDEVNKALALNQEARTIEVKSPASGEALFETKNAQKIDVGSDVKVGAALLFINQSSGLRIDIDINEINVNQLHVGQPARITSVAFPTMQLKGYVQAIDAQAKAGNNLPTFSAIIVVPQLTNEQEKIIRFGMSAKIAIQTQHKADVLIPISAVTRKDKDYYVNKLASDGKTVVSVPVKVGDTTLNDVEIISGLKAGDKIVLPD